MDPQIFDNALAQHVSSCVIGAVMRAGVPFMDVGSLAVAYHVRSKQVAICFLPLAGWPGTLNITESIRELNLCLKDTLSVFMLPKTGRVLVLFTLAQPILTGWTNSVFRIHPAQTLHVLPSPTNKPHNHL